MAVFTWGTPGSKVETEPVHGGTIGTLKVKISDPQSEVASIEFNVVAIDAAGTEVRSSGPHPPDITRRVGWYEKDVVLDASLRTRVEVILRREDSSFILPVATTSELFGVRTATGVGGEVRVQDSDTSAVVASTLVFQGSVVSVDGGIATFNLDGRYVVRGETAVDLTNYYTKSEGDARYPSLAGAAFTGAVWLPYLTVGAQDGGSEGGEVKLAGAAANDAVYLDNFAGRFRVHTPGTTLFEVDAASMRYMGTAVSLAGHAHDDLYYTEAEADGRFQPLNAAIGDSQLSANVPRFSAGGVFTGAARLEFQTGTTGWAGWNVPVTFSDASHAAIAATGANLLMGFHSDGNFYWADTTPGSGGYRMRLDRAGNLWPTGAVVAAGFGGHVLQLGGTRSAGRGTITETPNLHLDSRDGSRIYLNFYNSTAATNVGGIDQGAYKLAVNGDIAAYGGGWLHNMAAGTGLVNDATGTYFYAASADKWRMSSATGMGFYAADNQTVRGYVHHDASGFGLLGSNGSWGLRVLPGGGTVESVGAWVPSGGVFLTSSQQGHAGTGPALYFDSTASVAYSIRKQNAHLDRTGQYATLVINHHTGIKLGANANSGGVQFYSDWVGSGTAALVAAFGYGGNTHLNMFGQQGIYFADYGGGWHMQDTTWVRVINNTSVYTAGTIRGGDRIAEAGAGGWGAARLYNGAEWGDGYVYPTLGSTAAGGGLAMLINPHLPFTTNNVSGAGETGSSKVRMAADGAGSAWWDMGVYSGERWVVARMGNPHVTGYGNGTFRFHYAVQADGGLQSNGHVSAASASIAGRTVPSIVIQPATSALPGGLPHGTLVLAY